MTITENYSMLNPVADRLVDATEKPVIGDGVDWIGLAIQKSYTEQPHQLYTVHKFIRDALAGYITEKNYAIRMKLVGEATRQTEDQILRHVADEISNGVYSAEAVEAIDPFVKKKIDSQPRYS